MRIISFIFSSFFVVAVLTVIAGLIGRESLLLIGSSKIQSSLTILERLSRDNLQIARQCREKGGTNADVATVGNMQLRFTNNKDYVIEVICNQFQSDPILISKDSLPVFVHKRAGSTGIIWGTDRSAIEIETFGRRKIIGVENEEIKSYSSGSVTLGESPQSTCEGYGYFCCQQETFSGVGQSFSGVSDCSRNCFSQCLPRPVVLSLNTDPFADDTKHTVTVVAGEPVTFSYVASYDIPDKTKPVSVTFDFGDGQHESFTTLSGKTSHRYDCPRGNCNFQTQLSIKGSNGIAAALTPITQLKVHVQ